MKVLFFWGGPGNMDPQFGNPYARLLAEALAQHGVTMAVAGSLNLWRYVFRSDIQALHFNWIAPHYAADSLPKALLQFVSFVAALLVAYLRGYRIVWTMHNLYPHEMAFPWIDRVIRLLTCRLAHAVIAHCQHAATLLAQHFGRTHCVHIIPHGEFITPYRNTISPEQARESLGLSPEDFVYLFVGNIRAYKGVAPLIDTFTTLEAEDARLLVAGRIHRSYQGGLPASATEDSRVVLKARAYEESIPADDMQIYLNASDVVVLPFLDTLTSGSAILSLGFGRPVIAPAVGCLPELLRGYGCGIVYEPHGQHGLKHALQLARTLDIPRAGQRARQRAESLSWDSIARLTLAAYGITQSGPTPNPLPQGKGL
ncbi:MAG: hypothetical protein CL878_14890 [Dehalococcoidia bacterium]|nr:hypothetical protein [Dehalococcoidia bacterium]